MPGLLELVQNLRIEDTENLLMSQEERVLRGILESLLINSGGLDLAQMFGPHRLWQPLRDLATSEAQRAIVKSMLSPKKDKGQLVDYINDLRSVRYSADVRDLCNLHGEPELYKLLKEHMEKHTVHSEKVILDVVREWDKKRMARVVAFLTSIADERDLEVILKNHRVDIGALDSFSLSGSTTSSAAPEEAAEAPAPTAPSGYSLGTQYISAGAPGLYDVIRFDLAVRIEFQKLPVLFRRLASSDWAVQVKHINVTKAGVLERQGAKDSADRRGEESAPAEGAPQRPGDDEPAARASDEEAAQALVAPREVVAVRMQCEAKHFLPLAEKVMGAEAEKAQAEKPAEREAKADKAETK